MKKFTGSVNANFSKNGFAGYGERKLGEEVHKQAYEDSMKELVFDEETGEFRQVSKGVVPRQGTIVTGMTKEGFAC